MDLLAKKILARLIVVIGFCFITNLAYAYQVNDVEVLRLARKGVLKDADELVQIALSEHLGSKLRKKSGLKRIYGRYVYRVALLDSKDIKWNVDLDAQTGEVISNMID